MPNIQFQISQPVTTLVETYPKSIQNFLRVNLLYTFRWDAISNGPVCSRKKEERKRIAYPKFEISQFFNIIGRKEILLVVCMKLRESVARLQRRCPLMMMISMCNGTSTPKGSYSAKTGVNCPMRLNRVHIRRLAQIISVRNTIAVERY